MKDNTIIYSKGEPSKIIISLNDPPGYVKIILLILLIICVLIPLLATFGPLLAGAGLGAGVIIAYLIFWAIGIFFLRLYLWHKHGSEEILISKSKISYIPDYRLFKGSIQSINNEQIKFGTEPYADNPDLFCFLTISNDTDKIQSVIKIKNNIASAVIKEIEN